MTRKDYILIASKIAEVRDFYNDGSNKDAVDAIDLLCDDLADVFKKDNGRFNATKFLLATGRTEVRV